MYFIFKQEKAILSVIKAKHMLVNSVVRLLFDCRRFPHFFVKAYVLSQVLGVRVRGSIFLLENEKEEYLFSSEAFQFNRV